MNLSSVDKQVWWLVPTLDNGNISKGLLVVLKLQTSFVERVNKKELFDVYQHPVVNFRLEGRSIPFTSIMFLNVVSLACCHCWTKKIKVFRATNFVWLVHILPGFVGEYSAKITHASLSS